MANIFDKVVEYISPSSAQRRMESRMILDSNRKNNSISNSMIHDETEVDKLRNQLDLARENHQRIYSASQYDPSLNPYSSIVSSPDKDVVSSIGIALRLVRDRMMNDPEAIRTCEIYCDSVHGEGIMPSPDSNHRDIEFKDLVDSVVTDRFDDHFETTDIDVNGQHDIYGLAWMAENEKACSGGALWIQVWNSRAEVIRKGLRHPMQLDVRSDRWLDNGITTYQEKDKNGQPIGPVYPVIGGIQINPSNKSVRGYHIYVNDPYDGLSNESIFIPAKYVTYDAERKQLGQLRGWPIMASIVPTLQNLEDLTTSSIQRAKIDTALSVILGVPMGYQNPSINDGASDGFSYANNGDGSLPQDGSGLPVNSHGTPVNYIQPGMITRVHKGTEVTTINPQPSNVYESTYRNSERRVAMAVSQTYESITGDYSKVNFVSGRLAKGPVNRSMRRRQWNWIVTVGKPLWRSFITGCYTMNSWNIEGYPEYPSYEDIKPTDVKWILPAPDSADPLGEHKADQLAVRMGKMDPIEMITRSGRDPEQVARGYKKAYDMFSNYGVNLDRMIFSGDGSNLSANSGLLNEDGSPKTFDEENQ